MNRVCIPGLFLILAACSDILPVSQNREVTLWIYSGNHQAAEVGTELPMPIVVLVKDLNGVPVEGVEILFQGDGRAVRTQPRTDRHGHALTYWQVGTKAGAQTIRATALAPNVPVVLFASEGVTGPAAAITQQDGTNPVVSPGTELDTLVVTVVDRHANPVTNSVISWSVQQGGGSVTPLSDRTDLAGRARAIWTLGSTVGLQQLVVTAGGISRPISATTGPAFVATQVVAGSDHTCALTIDSSAYCWGSNLGGTTGARLHGLRSEHVSRAHRGIRVQDADRGWGAYLRADQ